MKHASTLTLGFLILAFLPGLSGAQISVIDDRGQAVVLDDPAESVASLMPHATDILAHLGAEGRVAGTLEYPDIPESMQSLPRLGDYYALSLEAIIQVDPDLIIAWPSSNIAAQLERLEALGYPIFYSDPQSFDEIAETYRRIGMLTGLANTGDRIAEDFLSGMEALATTYSAREPVTVFYQTWNDPVFSVNGDNFIGRVITQCGGINPFENAGPLAPQVSKEAVLNARPDILITGGDSTGPLSIWREYTAMPAVQNNELHAVDSDLTARPTRTLLRGAQEICTIIDGARKTRYTKP